MLLKLLIIGGVLYALYRFAGGKLPTLGSGSRKEEREPEGEEETLVECAKCGTYVVKKEAILYKGKYYCSRECLPR
jgi:uncharacterized protein